MPELDNPTLLTVPEVADVLRISPASVRRLIDAGKLPAVRLGPRLIRVHRSGLPRQVQPGGLPNVVC